MRSQPKMRIVLLGILFLLAGCDSLNSRRNVAEVSNKSGIVYFMPKAVVHITLRGKVTGDNDAVKLDFDSEKGSFNLINDPLEDIKYVADRSKTYRVKYHPSGTAYDKMSIKVTPEGFLDSIKSDVDDKSVDIAKKAIDLGVSIATRTPPPQKEKPQSGSFKLNSANEKSFDFDFWFDPTDESHIEAISSSLKEAGFAFKVTKKPSYESANNDQNGIERSKEGVGGVYFRVPIPYQIEIRHEKAAWIRQRVVDIPNEAPVGWMDVSRAFAVKKITNISFKNGMISSWDVDKPSEVLAFMDVPLYAASAVFSIPKKAADAVTPNPSAKSQAEAKKANAEARIVEAEAVKKEIDAENSTLDSQRKLIDDQIRLIEAQIRLEKEKRLSKEGGNKPSTTPANGAPNHNVEN